MSSFKDRRFRTDCFFVIEEASTIATAFIVVSYLKLSEVAPIFNILSNKFRVMSCLPDAKHGHLFVFSLGDVDDEDVITAVETLPTWDGWVRAVRMINW